MLYLRHAAIYTSRAIHRPPIRFSHPKMLHTRALRSTMFKAKKNSAAVADTLIRVGDAAAVAPSTTFKYVKYAAAVAVGGIFCTFGTFLVYAEMNLIPPFSRLEREKTERE